MEVYKCPESRYNMGYISNILYRALSKIIFYLLQNGSGSTRLDALANE